MLRLFIDVFVRGCTAADITSPYLQTFPSQSLPQQCLHLVMSNDAIKLKPAGTTYGVIHRLGLKYAPPAVARPTFEPQATLAKEFWQDMFIVFDNFRQTAIDESSARLAILTLVDEYGPRIWGADRVNVVSYPCQHCPEYSKDLYWDEGEETRQLYEPSITIPILFS